MNAALLVGIDRYESSPLQGCVNDIMAPGGWRSLLQHGPAAVSETRVLLDRDATQDNILKGLQWLSTTGADHVYFVFSGHGTRIPDTDGDEATGYDQAIVPVDYLRTGLITDDVLGYSYWNMTHRVTVILDTCFSAKSERSLTLSQTLKKVYGTWRHRYTQVPEYVKRLSLIHQDRSIPLAMRSLPQPADRGNVVLLAACRHNEVAADAYMPEAGRFHGAASFALQRILSRHNAHELSYISLAAEANGWLKQERFPQRIQIGGREEWLQNPIWT